MDGGREKIGFWFGCDTVIPAPFGPLRQESQDELRPEWYMREDPNWLKTKKERGKGTNYFDIEV